VLVSVCSLVFTARRIEGFWGTHLCIRNASEEQLPLDWNHLKETELPYLLAQIWLTCRSSGRRRGNRGLHPCFSTPCERQSYLNDQATLRTIACFHGSTMQSDGAFCDSETEANAAGFAAA
jgi:hypothetical protein